MALNQQPFAVAVLEHRGHPHGEFKCPPAFPLPRPSAATQATCPELKMWLGLSSKSSASVWA
jgi:hypothetical protein